MFDPPPPACLGAAPLGRPHSVVVVLAHVDERKVHKRSLRERQKDAAQKTGALAGWPCLSSSPPQATRGQLGALAHASAAAAAEHAVRAGSKHVRSVSHHVQGLEELALVRGTVTVHGNRHVRLVVVLLGKGEAGLHDAVQGKACREFGGRHPDECVRAFGRYSATGRWNPFP